MGEPSCFGGEPHRAMKVHFFTLAVNLWNVQAPAKIRQEPRVN